MIVVGVVLKGLPAVRTLVYGGHAAEFGEASSADVLLDAKHEEVVGAGLEAEVIGFPSVTALGAMDTRLEAVLVPSHHSLSLLSFLRWFSIVVVILILELLRVGKPLKSFNQDLEGFRRNLGSWILVRVHLGADHQVGFP